MFEFNAENYVPRFLLNDKNGYAIAKAIEAGLNLLNSSAETAFEQMHDVDLMPEWRLDELAWEINGFYDNNVSVDIKRKWIKKALVTANIHGTKQALINYVGAYFDNFDVLENPEGNQFHIQVTMGSKWDEEKYNWILLALDKAKNVRTVVDYIIPSVKAQVGLITNIELIGSASLLTSKETLTGTWPEGTEKTEV